MLLTLSPAIVQRVLSASVAVDNEVISSIGKGILVLAAVAPGDTEKDAETLANKVLKLKLWDDEAGARVRLLTINPRSPMPLTNTVPVEEDRPGH